MGHNLATSGGRHCVFAVGDMWHKFGTSVTEAKTYLQALIMAALDWTVSVEDAYALGAAGMELISGVRAIRRDDTGEIISSTGDAWNPIQNRVAFEFMDSVLGEHGANYHTAGALGNGGRVWMQAKLPKGIRIRGSKDVSDAYFTVTNSHMGNESMRGWMSLQRIVCQNTYNLAVGMRGKFDGFRIRHSKNATAAIADARKALGIAVQTFEQSDEVCNRLAEKPVTAAGFEDYLSALIPDNAEAKKNTRTENIRAAVVSNFADHEFPETSGTWWAAFNAVTRYVDHDRSVRGADDDARDANRFESGWFGTGADIKADAWDMAVERAEITLPAMTR